MNIYIITITTLALFSSNLIGEDFTESLKNQPSSTSKAGLTGESNASALKIGFIDMNRFFTEYPRTKLAENSLNSERIKIKMQLDQLLSKLKAMKAGIDQQSGAARENSLTQVRNLEKEVSEFTTSREKVLQEQFKEMRNKILVELLPIVKEVSDNNGINILYDKSGMSTGQVPVVLYTKGVFDITDACIEMGKSR